MGADPEERAAIPLMENTNQRLEGNKEETLSQTEKRQQEDEKLEGKQVKAPLTGEDQDQDKSWERKKAQQQLVQQLWGVQA